jgi:hypothetical protein
MNRRYAMAGFLLLAAASAGCSPRSMIANSMADSMARGSVVYQTDDDPQLVGDALPFALKLMESLIVETPKNDKLLVTASQSFTQYANAFVEMDAFRIEPDDPAKAHGIEQRAKLLYLRARDYGFRALELKVPDFRESMNTDLEGTLAKFDAREVPALYWTAAAWASAIGADKTDLDLAADLPLIEPIVRRCLALDESYGEGALHEFMMLLKGSLSEAGAGDPEEARHEYERAMELAAGERISPLVSYAETIAVKEQDVDMFRRLLQQSRIDDYFL